MINNFLFPSETSQILPTSGKGFMNTCRILKYGELKFYEKGLENSDKTYKPIVLFPVYVPLLIDIKIIAIADPILIKSILKEEFREKNSLLNGEGFADAVKQLVGSNNVFTVNREKHEILRQLFYKPLMTDQIQQYQPLFKSLSIEFLDRWAAKKEKKEEISIFHEMQKFTLKAFLETLLGFSYNNPDDLSYSLNYFIKILGDLTLKKTDVQKLESDQKYQNCRTVIHQVIEAIFANSNKTCESNYFSMLLKARTEQLITQEEIVEMLYVIFGAGMETTASSLSSMIYCLAAYPEWQETLYQEIETLDEHQPKFLKSLVKMPLFMKEVFRLYPPIWAQARGVNDQDYSLNNQYILPKNSLILMLPYFSQRSSTYWTNPQKFDPNRFDANYREQYPIDKAAHLIHFSYGKDDCIGRFFAEDLIKSFLVQLIKFYTLKTHAEAKPKQGPLAMYLDPLKIEIIPRSFED